MNCPDCFSENVTTPDNEGLVDCLDCGVWFAPDNRLNVTCGHNLLTANIGADPKTGEVYCFSCNPPRRLSA